MMIRNTLCLIGLCAVVFVVSFAGTLAARSQSPPETRPCAGSPLARWLDLDPQATEIIEAHDPEFTEEVKSLRQQLASARSALAALLEDEDVSNDRILAQVEDCIAAHNTLERRVTAYLLSVRDHLTPDQQKRLFRLCADGVRQGRGYGWGRGAGRGFGGGGRGFGGGRGHGGGPGHNHEDASP